MEEGKLIGKRRERKSHFQRMKKRGGGGGVVVGGGAEGEGSREGEVDMVFKLFL